MLIFVLPSYFPLWKMKTKMRQNETKNETKMR
jgi:hypothetical protein